LLPGDWVLLYTDGIPETNNPAEVEFGDECFRQFLGGVRSGSADQFADRLLDEVARWAEREASEDLTDDITMVAVHVQE
jgi:sigma-B regulation protein RsbU (phosphoserine phosphatase)/two-component system sensor histidine kinase ChiS